MSDPAPTDPAPPDAAANQDGKVHDLGRQVETGLQRVRRMRYEMHALAHEQVEILTRDIATMAERAAEIAAGGDAYPIGVRELCTRLADDFALQAQTLQAILERAPED